MGADAAGELDLAAFPAEVGRSLLDVIGTRLRLRVASVPRHANQPLMVLVAVGAAIGTGLGLILI